LKSINWKDIAELIGIAAIVISLIFVGLQLQQDREIATAQLFADYDNTVLEWGGLISDNHDVWSRGLKGKELDEAESATFYTLGGTFFFKEGGRFVRAQTMSSYSPSRVVNYVAQTIFKYPALERVWRQQPFVLQQKAEGRIGPLVEFVNGIERVLESLKSGETAPWGMTDNFAPM
jgi:hypothetical protein